MDYKKLKILAIILISYNTFNPIIVSADELIGSKTTEIVDTPEVNEDTPEVNEKHYATGVGKSNPTDIVNIPDDALREYISKQLGKSPTDDITVADMERLPIVEIDGNEAIKDLTGLEYAINTKYISVRGQKVNDLTPLSNLTNLEVLYLRNNQISDISALSNLTNLDSLGLAGNQISDISALSNLTNVEAIFLDNNQISDISALSNLTNLKSLSLDGNQISDISTLSNLTNLKSLSLDGNQISDISTLSNLSKLFNLVISNNKITDISPLQNLTELSYLFMQNNQISDISSTPTSVLMFEAGDQVINIDAGEISIPEYENFEFNVIDYDGTKIPIDLGTPDLNGDTKEIDWISSGASDFSGTFKFTYVIKTKAPEIIGAEDLELTLGDTINLMNGVSATDAEDGDLTSKIVVDDSKVDYNKTGSYNVTYSVTDSDGKTTTKTIKLTIVRDLVKPVNPITPEIGSVPTIDGTKDLTVKLGEKIDLLAGINASDAEDGDLTDKIVVDDSKVDYTNAGKYEVTYLVTDSDGNTTTKTIIIEIIDEIDMIDITPEIPINPEKPQVVDPINPEKPEVVNPINPENPKVVDPEKPQVVDTSNPENAQVIVPESDNNDNKLTDTGIMLKINYVIIMMIGLIVTIIVRRRY